MEDRVDDAEGLWRRVHRTYWIERTDGQGHRVSPGAFRTSDPQLSVDRERILRSLGFDESFTAAGEPAVAELSAEQFRALSLDPVADPLPAGDPFAPAGNPAHAVVRRKLTKGEAKALADQCTPIPVRATDG